MRVVILTLALVVISSQVFAGEENPLEKLRATAGNDADSLIRLGDLYVEAKRLSDAKKVYKKAQWKGEKAEARFGLIKISMAENKFQQAKFYCRKLEQQHPKDSAGDVCSGWFWLGNARSSRAIEAFEKAIEKGDVARGKTGIGEAKLRLAKWDEAISAYQEAISAGANYLADLGLGLALEKKGDTAQAIESIKKAVEKEPASSLAHFHLGRLISDAGRAERELKLAILIRPKWYEAYETLGILYEKSGKLTEAGTAYQRATEIDGLRVDAYYGLAKVRHKEAKLDEAINALQKVIDKVPNHADAYLLFAEIYYQKKEPDQAIEALDRAREVASGDIDVYVRSAEIYMELGRYTNARAYLSHAVSLRPKNSKVLMMLGDIACKRKRPDEGKKYYKKALAGDLKGVDKKAIEEKQAACK
jgi:tetratricopeptide (TPR) repeat protein